jgi:tRNA-2-methylthio-N6-dimethylallyladenosine synthase
MKHKALFINTMGCQMNVYDSGQIRNHLAHLGFISTEDPAEADVIILNTCAIREKAEQKAFSFLGRLADLKKKKPELIIGVGGCVAQQEGRRILSRVPHVDLVFGTHAIGRLARSIERISATRCRVVDVRTTTEIDPGDFASGPYSHSNASAFVTIMRGCDNYCTYCVVPYVRGRESSRRPEAILQEIHRLVDDGVREVTLLGQNVNSYGQKEKLCHFAQLLAQVNDIQRLSRIRFTTSHPKDLSDELIQAFTQLKKLCRHIHLPVQSGSNRILKRMNRRYTLEDYTKKVDALKAVCPDIAITSDIIVGFPGESENDFQATLDLIQEMKFDGLFTFAFSNRPNAPAARFDRQVEENVKKERLQAVLACQEKITQNKNHQLVGTEQEVLVDGPSAGSSAQAPGTEQWSGRNPGNKIVHFYHPHGEGKNNQWLTGRVMNIMIEKALPHCLWGRPRSASISYE